MGWANIDLLSSSTAQSAIQNVFDLAEAEPAARVRQPRVLVLGSFLGCAALERYPSGDLANRLTQRGWNVLVCSRRTGRLARLADMMSTTIRERSRYDVAVVDVFSGPAFFLAEFVSAILRRLRKPFALTLHGGNLPAFARRCPSRVRRLLQSASVVTTPSKYLLDAMRPFRGDVHLIRNALDMACYSFRLRAKPQASLVWLRAFHAIYNPVMAVECLGFLSAAQATATLALARRRARELVVENRLEIVGSVSKSRVPAELALGDIFLNTTNYDSFGVSVAEAAACGLCVITTAVGEHPHLWQDGHDALLVPPNDARAMAAAVQRSLTEPGLAERLSRNARAKAEQFDWSVILPQWEALLMEVAGSKVQDEGSGSAE
jgi:glycosyltransferase involved in cell wall biosynthesis